MSHTKQQAIDKLSAIRAKLTNLDIESAMDDGYDSDNMAQNWVFSGMARKLNCIRKEILDVTVFGVDNAELENVRKGVTGYNLNLTEEYYGYLVSVIDAEIEYLK